MSALMPDCSMEGIIASARQCLKGEIEAQEFRGKLLPRADQGTLIDLAKAIADNAEDTA